MMKLWLLEDVLDVLASLLGRGLGLLVLAFGLLSVITGRGAGCFLGLAGEVFGGVLDLVGCADAVLLRLRWFRGNQWVRLR